MDKIKVILFVLAVSFVWGACLPGAGQEAKPGQQPKEPGSRPLPKRQVRTRLTVSEEQFIIKRRPFALGEEEKPLKKPPVRKPPKQKQAPPPVSNSRFRLLGTIAAGKKGWAVILDTQSSKEGLFRAVCEITPSIKLLAVERNRALLESGGRRFYITSQKGGSSPPAPTPKAQTSPAPSIASTADSQMPQRQTITLANTDIAANMKNLSRLFSQIRFAPYFEKGRQLGFKILNVRTGSFPERVGAQKGDIVQAVNGKSLTSVRAAFDIFRGVKDSPTVSLSIIRQGKPFVIDLQRR